MANALFEYLVLCIAAIVVLVFAISFTLIYDALPNAQAQNAMAIVYNWTFGFFDKSFIIILLVILFGSGLVAYFKPNMLVGIFDLVCLLIFGFVFINLRGGFTQLATPLSMNTLMPNTYAVINSNWVALLVLFTVAVEGMFNFRPTRRSEAEHEE